MIDPNLMHSGRGGIPGVHWRHDERTCWDCNGIGLVANSVSLAITEKTLCLIGWRFLEPHGRMVCSSCAAVRGADAKAVR